MGRRYGWPRRGRSRPAGCLMWVVGLIIVLIILAVLFGGFQKGSKVGGLGRLSPSQAAGQAAGFLPAQSPLAPLARFSGWPDWRYPDDAHPAS